MTELIHLTIFYIFHNFQFFTKVSVRGEETKTCYIVYAVLSALLHVSVGTESWIMQYLIAVFGRNFTSVI